jgi:hypothetical protein
LGALGLERLVAIRVGVVHGRSSTGIVVLGGMKSVEDRGLESSFVEVLLLLLLLLLLVVVVVGGLLCRLLQRCLHRFANGRSNALTDVFLEGIEFETDLAHFRLDCFQFGLDLFLDFFLDHCLELLFQGSAELSECFLSHRRSRRGIAGLKYKNLAFVEYT